MDKPNKQIINTKIKKYGGSNYILLPKHLNEYINAEPDQEVKIMTTKSKHGKYLAIWNPKQQEE